MKSRRSFLGKVSIGALGFAAVPALANTNMPFSSLSKIPGELTILFQGDSITDAGRDRARYYPNDSGGMGNGYVYQIVSELLGSNPEINLKCYNRGISGNKVYQLAQRWEDDCLQLNPDVLSILIGVNDFWHSLGAGYKGTVKTYESDFRELLDRTKKAIPNVKLIIGEPFAVEGGSAITSEWYTDFPNYRNAAKKIARDYDAVFIPYQEIFNNALQTAPVSYWCPDGVHPSMAGAFLMKLAWLDAFNRLWK